MDSRTRKALLQALAICVGFAVLEGLTAGADAGQRYASMRLPSWSPPFWAWLIVGVTYYLICGFVLHRIFSGGDVKGQRAVALGLLLLMMGINAVWNVVFFQSNDLRLAFFVVLPYDAVALTLFIVLRRLDRLTAWGFSPYLAYLIYANIWGYGVWRANAALGA